MSIKRYFPGPAAFFSAGPDNYIVFNFINKNISTISKQEAFQYSRLSGITTEEDHLNKLLDLNDPCWSIEKYQEFFNHLKKERLLFEMPFFCENKTAKNYLSTDIAVTTCNRVQLLKNTLYSISTGIGKTHINIPITVLDDSENTEIQEKNRDITSEAEKKCTVKSSYFGNKEKKSYIQSLGKEIEKRGISRKRLEFALFGHKSFTMIKSSGTNRNATLLRFAGRKYISFDDDVRYQFGLSLHNNNNIELSYLKDPDKYIFENNDKSYNNFKHIEFDPVYYINEILGESISALIDKTEKTGGKVISDEFRPEPENLPGDKQSRVKAAMLGIYGGRWYNRPFGIYYYNAPERNKVFKKRSEYLNIKKNPYSLMLPDNLTLSRAPFFVATAFGIDAREITPPFTPFGRNDDGIWSAILLAIEKKSFIAHCPFAVYHETENKSEFTEKDFNDTTAGFGILTVLIMDFIKTNILSIFPEITYETFGKQLITLSKLPDKHFISLCHSIWLDYTAKSISKLEILLSDYNEKPKHWANDVKGYINLLSEQSLNPSSSLPGELKQHYSTEEIISVYKTFLNEYGKLIEDWPVIWEESVKLNAERGKSIE